MQTTKVGQEAALPRVSPWATPRVQRAITAILVALAIAMPLVISGYWVRLLTGIFMYAALATSMNIIAGYTGYADFGNVVYFGVGAYATGILASKFGVPLPIALVIAALICAAYAMVLGLPILRLRGHYFAIATIGVMEATRELIINFEGLTGGGTGLTLPIPNLRPQQFYLLIYYAMLGLCLAYVTTSALIRRSRFGFGLRAIKADEEAAEVSGIDTTRYKIMAWMTSATMSGLIGGVYAYWYSYIQPGEVFTFVIGTKYMIMMLLGGAGTVLGPVIGAFALELVSETVWSQFLELHLGVLGTIIVLAVMFMPRGVLSMIRGGWKPKAWLQEFRENRL